MDLPESVTVMVLARLEIRDISRLKLVCRGWKSLMESSYFRDLYETTNQRKLSSPWSILYIDESFDAALDFFCERWGFTQSLGSCVSRFLNEMKAERKTRQANSALAITDGLILLGISTKFGPNFFTVANPVLQKWIYIPKPPPSSTYNVLYNGLLGAALVTDMNNGDLLGYKVVRYGFDIRGACLYLQIFSSDSGNWTCHYAHVQRPISNLRAIPINLNGYLHWLCRANQVLVAYDFYSRSKLCRVIRLPRLANPVGHGAKETLTISCGSLMYMNTYTGKINQQLKIWRLKNYTSCSSDESWELLCSGLDICHATSPVAMHPFDKEIVYLVTRQTDDSQTHAYLVSGNLGTKRSQVHQDWKQKYSKSRDYHPCFFLQFVLPQRLGSITCPPGCTLATLPDRPTLAS